MIQTRGLRYRYPAGPDLHFADLDVPQGGRLLLRGNSGSGKSTWLALAAGMLTASGGEIAVAGQPLDGLSQTRRDHWRARSLGFLPQKLHLSDALTVQGNLALVYFAAGVPEDRAAIGRALDALGVAAVASKKPAQLSGGQAQRVALARATLLAPQVILADEPTASLDDEAAGQALQLLAQTAQHCRATLVIATHDRRAETAFPAAFVYKIGLQPASVGTV